MNPHFPDLTDTEEEFKNIHIGQPGPAITHLEGVSHPLLQAAHTVAPETAAETVLTSLYYRCRDQATGRPLGAMDKDDLDDHHWMKVDSAEPKAALIDIASPDGSTCTLALNRDGSALLFKHADETTLLPVPQAYRLVLPSSIEDTDLSDLAARTFEGEPVDLAQFLNSIEPSVVMEGASPRGEAFPLHHALRHEVSAWSDWMNTALPVVNSTSDETDSEDPWVLYSWIRYCQPLHIEHANRLVPVFHGLIDLIASQEGLSREDINYAAIDGRTINRDGSLSDVNLGLLLERKVNGATGMDIAHKWRDYTARLFNHPDIPVPPKAQVSYDHALPLPLLGLDFFPFDKEESAHQKLANLDTVLTMAGEVP